MVATNICFPVKDTGKNTLKWNKEQYESVNLGCWYIKSTLY